MFTIELTKYLILRKINAHFEFDDSSPSQDPGTGHAFPHARIMSP